MTRDMTDPTPDPTDMTLELVVVERLVGTLQEVATDLHAVRQLVLSGEPDGGAVASRLERSEGLVEGLADGIVTRAALLVGV